MALRRNTTLRKLDISNNNLSYDGAVDISECLTVHCTLVELNISSCNIICKGAVAIFKSMHSNTSIQVLSVLNNHLSTSAITIREFLKVNKSLLHLDISANNITCEGTKTIIEGLKTNKTLTELHMSSNHIANKGAKAIAIALDFNTVLLKLDISDNKITDEGVTAIGNNLKTNPTLLEFDISMNNITDEGAKVFAEIIQMNKTLQSLVISFNSNNGKFASYTVSDRVYKSFEQPRLSEGEIRIVEAMLVNTSLLSLKVCFCFSYTTFAFNLALVDAMYHNNTLTRLTLSLHDSDLLRMKRNAILDINKKRKELGLNCLHMIAGCPHQRDFTEDIDIHNFLI
ncbi:NLR family CARD domain-containing protein 3-like isoform X1 [Dysidea avara]|uniref:NLR family CARD domain-containing protein 3-like isoform X1 n=1 Tax=Dysidea avara TaxID=196820 RepID=UPI00332F41CB